MMNIKDNPPCRISLIWTGIAVLGIIIIFIPRIIGLDGPKGGSAVSLLGGFVALAGVIAAIIFLRLAVSLERIIKKERVLAHWTYTPEVWAGYKQGEHAGDVSTNRGAFVMIAAISLILVLTLWIIMRDNPLAIIISVLCIIAVAGLTAYLSARSSYRRNKEHPGEAYISLDGVYLNRKMHIWRGIGNHLENAAYDDTTSSQPRMVFKYSSPGQGERYYYTARVPVPPGQGELARDIVAKIAAAHLSKSKKS
jgi:hypothetical protein